MGIEIPESLQRVAKYVVAGDWPEGDETATRRVEDAWVKLATDLMRYFTAADPSMVDQEFLRFVDDMLLAPF